MSQQVPDSDILYSLKFHILFHPERVVLMLEFQFKKCDCVLRLFKRRAALAAFCFVEKKEVTVLCTILVR